MPKRAKGRNPNSLPEHIGAAFQRELTELIFSLSGNSYKEQYQAECYLSKYCDSSTTPAGVRRQAAIAKWLATETRNRDTNMRLYEANMEEVQLNCGLKWDSVLFQARKTVRTVLGPLRYPSILWDGGHTNGASTRVGRSPRAAIDKLTGAAHCSSSARDHWFHAVSNSRLEDQTLACQELSMMFTVPKSTDIDRVACKEPEVNMFLQRSVGNHIRRRLKRIASIDLNDQSRNRALARLGSISGSLATVDLSSASDSISTQLVLNLLPPEWYFLLDDLRVKGCLIEDQEHSFEMFSSMGNGFTFELESLLFYALVRATAYLTGTKGPISVYGDDIICPVSLESPLLDVFSFAGFVVNEKKSFFFGGFRESCGGHYQHGVDVTPFYLREPVREITDLIRALNQLLEWNSRGWGFILDEPVAAFHLKWSRLVPKALWGGQDLESITSLVTGHRPRKRLTRKRIGLSTNEDARLTLWLLTRQFGKGEFLSTDEWYRILELLERESTSILTCDEPSLPLTCDPELEGKWVTTDQPGWLERTTISPYLIFPELVQETRAMTR